MAFTGTHVMPVTVLGADGTGQDGDIIAGVVYAADHGADVILMAFSNPGYSQSLQDAIDYAWSQGVVVVAATGNDGSADPTFPAGDRGVIGVSNTDATDTLNASSNYGQATFLAAPGTGVLTTAAGGGYTSITGTSASAAMVAGAAALLKAGSVGASNGVIVSRLARNADVAGTADQSGNGRLNLDRAIVDTSSDSIEPAGAAPVGDGGPFVGPYTVAAGAKMNKIFSDPALSNEDYQFAVGDTAYAQASNLVPGAGYELTAKNAAGTTVYTGACQIAPASKVLSDSYVPTTPSGAADWTWVLVQWDGQNGSVLNSSCTGTSSSTDADNTLGFAVAQATAYTTAALNTTAMTYNAGDTAFVVVNGMNQSVNDWSATWMKSGVSCANTGGGDRPDSDASCKLPSTYLAYPPANAFADAWNKLSSYETATCPAFDAANAGQWQLTLTKDATHTVTLDVFGVQVAATKLAITAVNGGSNVASGSPFSVTVQSQAASGSPASVATATSFTLSMNTGSGAIGGTINGTIPAGSNSVTVSGVTYTNASGETGVTLAATRTSGDSLSPGISDPFIVVGSPSKLAFTTSPSGSTGGVAFATQPVVQVQDSVGNLVTTDNSTQVTLTITSGTGTAGAALTCATNPVTVSAGVASFAGCKVDKAGTGYTLTATSSSLTSATSNAFTITVGPPAQIAVTVNGGNNPTATIGFPVVAQTQDLGGNPANVTSNKVVTLTKTAGTAGTLGGTLSAPLNSGQNTVTISGVTYSQAATGVVIRATTTGGGANFVGDSAPFTVDAVTPTKLAITSVNGGASVTSGTSFSVVVESQDLNSIARPVSAATNVTLSVDTGTGTIGGTVTGTIPAGSSSVTISGVTYTKAAGEDGVKLAATRTSGDSLAAGTSAAFSVLGTPTLVFTQQPSASTAAGAAFATQPKVTIKDAAGHVFTTDNSTQVAIDLTDGTGSSGANLTCATNPVTVVNGVATFSACEVDIPGVGYTLTATSTPDFGTATSSQFTITGNITRLPLRSDFTMNVSGVGATTQTISTQFDTTVSQLAFNGTTTYDFYSAPLATATSLLSTDKGGGVFWMKVGGSAGANDLDLKARIEYYDYNQSTATRTLIVNTGDGAKVTIKHNTTNKVTAANMAIGGSGYTLAAGHLLQARIIITLLSGTPSGDFFLYNGPSGTAGASVLYLPQQNDATWNFGPFNQAPTAAGQSVSTAEDTAKSITLSGTDPDGNNLTFSVVSGPSNGSLGSIGTPSCSGTPSTCTANVTYTPAANYNGADSFTFKVNDGAFDSATATVSITVTAVNDPPVANNNSYSTAEDTALTVAAPGVLGNDTDVESNTLSAVLVAAPSHGALNLGANGGFTYTPAANYNGLDSFMYKANDGNADSNVATVSLAVTATNDAPVAADDSYSTNEDVALNVAGCARERQRRRR